MALELLLNLVRLQNGRGQKETFMSVDVLLMYLKDPVVIALSLFCLWMIFLVKKMILS